MIRVAFTDPLRTSAEQERYLSWLTRPFSDLTVRVLVAGRSDPEGLAGCHGLLLSGGGDIDPREYGRDDARELVDEVRPERDRLERELIEEALRRGMPLLGICRGMQMANVALGGTLIPDLERAGYSGHRAEKGVIQRHRVAVDGAARFSNQFGAREGIVVSSHHQAVDRPADGLKVVARSDDGVVEAMEWAEPNRSPLLLVQWHPERMAEGEGPLTTGVREWFVQATRAYAEGDEIALSQRTHIQSEGEQ